MGPMQDVNHLSAGRRAYIDCGVLMVWPICGLYVEGRMAMRPYGGGFGDV